MKIRTEEQISRLRAMARECSDTADMMEGMLGVVEAARHIPVRRAGEGPIVITRVEAGRLDDAFVRLHKMVG